jgi:hypothetical protein
MSTEFFDPVDVQVEPEILLSRRAWAVSQAAFDGGLLRVAASFEPVGWHSNEIYSETGAIAVVQAGGGLDDLVGEIVRVRRRLPGGDRVALVYVAGSEATPQRFSVSRRVFLALGNLALETVVAKLEVVA